MPTPRALRIAVAAGAATAAFLPAASALAAPPTPQPVTCSDVCTVDPTWYKTWLGATEAWAKAAPKPNPVPCSDACLVDPTFARTWEREVIDWLT